MKRLAMVIGVGAYPTQRLKNSAFDARRAAAALRSRGFLITLLEDADLSLIKNNLADFAEGSKAADLALIYLAGHAVERRGSGYFLPVDFPFPVSPLTAKHYAVGLHDVITAASSAKTGVVVLDACRNWPCGPEDEVLHLQLDQMAEGQHNWRNMLVAYSTSSTRTAGDGLAGKGSAFTTAFCQHLLDHNLSVDECFRRISQDVLKSDRHRQQPWTYSSLESGLTFSDLPKFRPKIRQFVPPEGKWCMPVGNMDAVLSGSDGPSVWLTSSQTSRRTASLEDQELVGAISLGERTVIASRSGKLFDTSEGAKPIARLSFQPNGLSISPSERKFAVYGRRCVQVFYVKNNRVVGGKSINLGFEAYCCLFLDDHELWVGGDNGKVAKVQLYGTNSLVTKVANLRYPVNEMALSRARDVVFCVTQGGNIAKLRVGATSTDYLTERIRPSTSAGIWATLSQIATDEIIHSYLFDRTRLSNDEFNILEEHLGYSALVSCSHAPRLPLLAAGTNEGTVLLFDTRDGQLVQELEITSGVSSYIYGLAFLSEMELAVLSRDGGVLFFTAQFG
jgi:WD40 repeat protein